MATLSPVKFFLSFSPKNLQEHVHLITFASKKKKKRVGDITGYLLCAADPVHPAIPVSHCFCTQGCALTKGDVILEQRAVWNTHIRSAD
jgi:hypothetical protein